MNECADCCDGSTLEESVETELFKVLDATNRWRIVEGTLELLNGDHVLARLQKIQGP